MSVEKAKILKRIGKYLCITAIVLIAMPWLLYIPPLQTLIKNIVVNQVNQSTGLKVSVGRILLKFPLDLNLDSVLVLGEKRDTMLCADNIVADVKFLPLLHSQVDVRHAALSGGVYKMVSEDSSLWLNGRAKMSNIKNVLVNLKNNNIDIADATVSGGNVFLNYDANKVKPTPEDTIKSEGWRVHARHIILKDVHYVMRMLPTIDRMDAQFAKAELVEGVIDTKKCTVHAHYLGVDRLLARYVYPTPQFVAAYPVKRDTVPPNPKDTTEWTITGDSVALTNSHAIYAMKGARPARGLDMNYIEAMGVNVGVRNFFNKGMMMIVPLTRFTAQERCGLHVTSGHGVFSMDSTMMSVRNFNVNTVLSSVSADATIGMKFFSGDMLAPVKLNLRAAIGIDEVGKLYPFTRPMLKRIPSFAPLQANVDMEGTAGVVKIKRAGLRLPKYASVGVSGRVVHPLEMRRINANIAFHGKLDNVNFMKPTLLDAKWAKQVNFPAVIVDGKARYAPGDISGNLAMRLTSGKMVFDGGWHSGSKSYAANLDLSTFPVHSIMPLGVIGNLSGSARVKGHGYDVYNPNTAIDATVHLGNLEYNKELYNDVTADVHLNRGKFDVKMLSKNNYCDVDMQANGIFKKNYYQFAMQSNVNYIDLKALKLSDTESSGQGQITAYGEIDLKNQAYDIDFNMKNFNWMLPDQYYYSPEVIASLVSNKKSISAVIEDNDLKVNFASACSLDTFIYKLQKCQKIAMGEYKHKSLNVDTLQRTLPAFSCDVSIGTNNLLQQFLENSNVKFKAINLNIDNDSTIYMQGKAIGLAMGTNKIDTLTMLANEQDKLLHYDFHVGNKRGTNDAFALVNLTGQIQGDSIQARLEQKNIRGETGFKLGMNAQLSDSVMNLKFYPHDMIIGYRPWTVNEDNEVALHYGEKHIDANLLLRSDSSYISLHTDHTSLDKQEDVLLKIAGVQIAEWMNLSPFAPPVSGILNADMKLKYDGKNFWGDGYTEVKNLNYDGNRVGDFKLNMLLDLNQEKNCVTMTSNMGVNGHCAVTAVGVLNDSTSKNPYKLVVELDSFPLSTASPFIPDGMAETEGYVSGMLNVIGTATSPIINGSVHCDSAVVNMPMFGSMLHLPTTKIDIDSSVVKFNAFKVTAVNANPIEVNGFVNLQKMDNVAMNLTLKGNNVEFVNSKQNRKSEVFGRGFADIDARIKGDMYNMYVNGNLALLPTSALTYVMQTDVSTISEKAGNSGLVKFVNFKDSTMQDIDSLNDIESAVKLRAMLDIRQGTKFDVFLSPDGKDRVRLEGSGILNFSQSPFGEMHLTGRYTIENGYVRYTPPLLSEKLFDFNSGSYVAWNGDLMNPLLSLGAVETLRANVTQEGQDSRLIDFLISLSVTNSFSNMAINFDLNTNDDLTVQNELQSMSASQRSSQAINLLLYGTYFGPGASSSATVGGNPLYSFLNSQLNRWAANTIKGVDLTLGINQYDETKSGNTSKTTTYSYKLSKSLFNDRFKIVVGGNYNPDESNSEDAFALGLLNDISFEYKLNDSGSMYVRLFRHTGYQSILEGEITEMGAGFVLKKKLTGLNKIFGEKKKRKQVATFTVDSMRLVPTKVRQIKLK